MKPDMHLHDVPGELLDHNELDGSDGLDLSPVRHLQHGENPH